MHLEVCAWLDQCFLGFSSVVSRIMVPKDVMPQPQIMLHCMVGVGGDFTDGIRLYTLGLGDHPRLFRWVPCKHIKPSKWRVFSGWSQKDTAEGEVREIPSRRRFWCTSASSGVQRPTYKDQRQASRSWMWPPDDSQWGSGDLSPKLKRKLILPTEWDWMSLPATLNISPASWHLGGSLVKPGAE